MKKRGFPKALVRTGYNSPYYCYILCDAYKKIENELSILNSEKVNPTTESKLKVEIETQKMIAVVFSAMCIEAHLNFYLSVVLGDEDFYGGERPKERLSVLHKIEIIANDCFNDKYIKERDIYNKIEKICEYRNELVHDKSREFDSSKFDISINEPSDDYVASYETEENCLINVEGLIKTIYEFAMYIDDHDENSGAVNGIFFTKYCNTYEYNQLDEEQGKFLNRFGISMR